MRNENRTRLIENYARRLFRNVSRNGDWVNFSCPLAPYVAEHKYKPDGSPSAGAVVGFTGNIVWRCFTCKGQGPLTNLLRTLEVKQKVDLSEIINSLNEADELPDFENRFVRPSELVCEPIEFADLFEDPQNFPDAAKYLADRNISPVTAKKLALGFDPDGKRITFPVYGKDKKLYGFTGRTILTDKGVPKIKDYYFPKSYFLLGMEHWQEGLPVILVEGLFAYARLHELSKGKYFPYNIGAIMGSSMSAHQIKQVIDFGSPVIAMLDNDAAGKAGMFGKPQHADWSDKKKEEERMKGMVFALKDHVPVLVIKWPKHTVERDGQLVEVEKDDPDQLTFDELSDILLNLRAIL